MSQLIEKEIRHFHLFCGSGGGAKGFNNGRAEVAGMRAKFRCLGGIDVDSAAINDFNNMAGVPGTVLDMFDRSQYLAFHGKEPGPDWREAGPDDIRKAANNERPNIVFLSAPCKGFSGLLSESRSKTEKYQALNRLTLRGVWLMLEAWGDDPPELILFENVPRIATRGRPLVNQIKTLLERYGYAVAETTHDCGELGGLAQSRKRFLLVARHMEKVQNYVYEPFKRPLRGVGEILEKLPIPGSGQGGPMHRVPELQWKTWVRLAFVKAGSDWRSLNRLQVTDGWLKDYLIVPEHQNGFMGVNHFRLFQTLWVREPVKIVEFSCSYHKSFVTYEFADGTKKRLRIPARLENEHGAAPSWAMPWKPAGVPNGCIREMARSYICIEKVYVERLQDGGDREFWGEERWKQNPWVWVFDFKRYEATDG